MSRTPTGRSHSGRPALSVCLLALACAPVGEAVGQAPRPAVEAREPWAAVFGGEPATFHVAVRGEGRAKLRLGWVFAIGRRSVATGEVEVADGPADVAIPLDVPPIKEGVVLPARLSLSLAEAGRAGSMATAEKPLWIFPKNPFADRSKWLKDLGLTLFDPARTTAEAFEKLGIPFEPARDVDAVLALKAGPLVVGEGASFAEQRGLAEAMVALAARGVPVLCLAPAEGAIPIPGGADAPAPRAIALRRQDVISELDKRLDAAGWPGEGDLVASGLVPKAEGDRLIAEVAAGPRGWPWLAVEYPGSKGRLVVCGFSLLKHWEAGPTPRFLLARLLEFVRGEVEDRPNPEKEAQP